MAGIFSVLIILALSILVTRIATVALTHTGLSREAAAFQSRSAFTGVGFTTDEAESAVNHPVRRRIIGTLMLLGNVGIVTVISSLILGFVGAGGAPGGWTRLLVLTGGVLILILIARSSAVDHLMSRVIGWALDRWSRLEVRDYEQLLHLTGDYGVRQLWVEEGDWLADCSLGELRLRAEGVNVLGVEKRDGGYVGVPDGDTRLEPGDQMIVYGRSGALTELDERGRGAAGDQAHEHAVARERGERGRNSPASS